MVRLASRAGIAKRDRVPPRAPSLLENPLIRQRIFLFYDRFYDRFIFQSVDSIPLRKLMRAQAIIRFEWLMNPRVVFQIFQIIIRPDR